MRRKHITICTGPEYVRSIVLANISDCGELAVIKGKYSGFWDVYDIRTGALIKHYHQTTATRAVQEARQLINDKVRESGLSIREIRNGFLKAEMDYKSNNK